MIFVGNFGVKYIGKEHAQHLTTVLKKHHTISHDWSVKCYLSIDLDWYYERRKFHLSMLLYVKKAFVRLNHAVSRHPQDQPHPHIKPKYGQKVQYTEAEIASPSLTATKDILLQEVLVVFLYCGRNIDSTMITTIGTIDTQESAPTENIMRNFYQSLDYSATHPDAIIDFHTSDMVLVCHSNASYLSGSKVRSRVSGYFPSPTTP